MKNKLMIICVCLMFVSISPFALAQQSGCDVYSKEFQVQERMYKNKEACSATTSLQECNLQRLGQMYDLTSKVMNVAIQYRDAADDVLRGNRWSREESSVHFELCVRYALVMRLTVAKEYVDIGVYDIPKQIYRDIISNFTGLLWASYVKQAEFGLEDLKAAESKK